MRSTSSRKSFLAKLGGLVAATGLMPRAVAQTGATAAAPAQRVQVRPETRAVARGSGNL